MQTTALLGLIKKTFRESGQLFFCSLYAKLTFFTKHIKQNKTKNPCLFLEVPPGSLHEHSDTSGKSPQVKRDIIFAWIETFKQHFYRKSHKNPSTAETFTSGCSLRSSKTEPSEWTLFNRRLRSRCLDSPLCSASGSNQRRSLHTTSVCIQRLPNCFSA